MDSKKTSATNFAVLGPALQDGHPVAAILQGRVKTFMTFC